MRDEIEKVFNDFWKFADNKLTNKETAELISAIQNEFSTRLIGEIEDLHFEMAERAERSEVQW